jgi:hypothetical protein
MLFWSGIKEIFDLSRFGKKVKSEKIEQKKKDLKIKKCVKTKKS